MTEEALSQSDQIPDRPPPEPPEETATTEQNHDEHIEAQSATLKRCLYREGQKSLKKSVNFFVDEFTEIPTDTNVDIVHQVADELSHKHLPISPASRHKQLNMKRYYCTQSHNLKQMDCDRILRLGGDDREVGAVHRDRQRSWPTLLKMGIAANVLVLALKVAAFYLSFSAAILATIIHGILDLVSWERCNRVSMPLTDSHFNHTKPPAPTTALIVSLILGFSYGALLALSISSLIWSPIFLIASEKAIMILLVAASIKIILLGISVRLKAPKRATMKCRNDLIAIGICLISLIMYKELKKYPMIDTIAAVFISLFVTVSWIQHLRMLGVRHLSVCSSEMARVLAMTLNHDKRLRVIERFQSDLLGDRVDIHLQIDFQPGVEHADAEKSSRQLRMKLEQLPFVHRAYVDVVQLERAAYH